MNIKKETNVKYLGIIFYLTGVFAALSAASKLPQEGSQYPDTVNLFIGAVVLAVVGVALWRGQDKKLAHYHFESADQKNQEDIGALIPKIVAKLTMIKSNFSNLGLCDLNEKIDTVLVELVHPIQDHQAALINQLGMAKASQVLLDLAYAERMLNRVWSASSDGHAEESRLSLDESLAAFESAQKTFSAFAS